MKKIIVAIILVAILCVGFAVNADALATDDVQIDTVIVSVGAVSKTVEVTVSTDSTELVAYFNGEAVMPSEDGSFTFVTNSEQPLSIYVAGQNSNGEEVRSDEVICALSRYTQVNRKYAQYVNTALGDANSDGITDVKDMVRIKKIVSELSDATSAADLGGDGSVTTLDLITAAKVILSKKAGMPLYTVTYAQKNGTVLQKKYVPEGFGTQPDVSAQKNGYEFIGWSAVATNVTKDTKIYANYYPDDIYTEWPEGFA